MHSMSVPTCKYVANNDSNRPRSSSEILEYLSISTTCNVIYVKYLQIHLFEKYLFFCHLLNSIFIYKLLTISFRFISKYTFKCSTNFQIAIQWFFYKAVFNKPKKVIHIELFWNPQFLAFLLFYYHMNAWYMEFLINDTK